MLIIEELGRLLDHGVSEIGIWTVPRWKWMRIWKLRVGDWRVKRGLDHLYCVSLAGEVVCLGLTSWSVDVPRRGDDVFPRGGRVHNSDNSDGIDAKWRK
jgi:hypothetical protein